jgi:hypothetical protein
MLEGSPYLAPEPSFVQPACPNRNDLTGLALCADTPLSAHCPRYLFDKRSEAVCRGVNAARAPPNLTKRKSPLGKAGRSRFEIIKHRTIP